MQNQYLWNTKTGTTPPRDMLDLPTNVLLLNFAAYKKFFLLTQVAMKEQQAVFVDPFLCFSQDRNKTVWRKT